MQPKYLSLSDDEFSDKIEELWNRLEACDLCGNEFKEEGRNEA